MRGGIAKKNKAQEINQSYYKFYKFKNLSLKMTK